MNIKKLILAFIVVLAASGAGAQVNLQTGALSHLIPITNYADNLSKLTLKIGLQYNSGNGLIVDKIPSAVGEGWNIAGIGFITRVTKGLPDDQAEKSGSWSDTTKYPPGYLYNTVSVTSGCPTALNSYPIFAGDGVNYTNPNSIGADRELDRFIYSFDGHNGTFVIDKNKEVRVLNGSRVKIDVVFGDITDNCRTLISQFSITNEAGILYEFSARERTRITRSKNADNWPIQTTGNNYKVAYEVQEAENPYVVTDWYVSSIRDIKNSRQIVFEYNYNTIRRNGRVLAQISFPKDYGSTGVSGFSVLASNKKPDLITLQELESLIKPEISKIKLPDNSELNFLYGEERKDCEGSFKLSAISVTDVNKSQLYKYKLMQSYFVKNRIEEPVVGEEKWARLCLTSIQQYGSTDFDITPSIKFDYYTGTSDQEDFVPPVYFHAQDPWGYYNGDLSGVAVNDFINLADTTAINKTITFNGPLNAAYAGGIPGFGLIETNAKPGYAKNGLLKEITNQYGGVTSFEYEQNMIDFSNNLRSIISKQQGVVGGVHISKIIEKESASGVASITAYDYTDGNGASSLWGYEQPMNMAIYKDHYVQEGKFLKPNYSCDYLYKYRGNMVMNRTKASPLARLYPIYKVFSIYNDFRSLVTSKFYKEHFSFRSELLNAKFFNYFTSVVNGLVENAVSCLIDPPFVLTDARTRSNSVLNFGNSLPRVFGMVTVRKYTSDGLSTGKTVYSYTTEKDYPLIVPENYYPFTDKIRYNDWQYGLLKSVKRYDNANKLVDETEHTYSFINKTLSDDAVTSCNCDVTYTSSMKYTDWLAETAVNTTTSTSISDKLGVEFYGISSGFQLLSSVTTKKYDAAGNAAIIVTNYTYNPINNLLATTTNTDSRNKVIIINNYYLEDYDLTQPGNSTLLAIRNDNMFNVPVSSETWQTKPGGQPELISASVTEYGTAPNGDYRPIKSHSLQTAAPVPLATIGSFDPTQLVRNPALIKPDIQYVYDAAGNAVQTNDLKGNRVSSVIFDYNNMYPVAAITNAAKNEVAYTSFEADGANSNWNLAGNGIVTDLVPTGNKCLEFNYGNITTPVAITKEYILSFWASSNSFTVNGGIAPAVTGPTINGWTFYQYKLPAGTASPVITGTYTSLCRIDELRLYPANAGIATTTYNPGIGKTSVCDLNNRIAYFEYDGLGRPSKERDEQRNLIKTYEYHYKQ
jgi:hypothetical protein